MDNNRKKYNWAKIISIGLFTALTLPVILMYLLPLIIVSALLDSLRGCRHTHAI